MVVLTHIIIYDPNQAIWIEGGLLSDAFFIILSQSVLGPLIRFINISSLIKSCQISRLRTKIKQGKADKIIQVEAQKTFEKVNFNPSLAYAAFANAIFTSFFFQPILPLGQALIFVALILNYFIFKRDLIRKCRTPIQISFNIAEVCLYLLNLIPFIYGLSSVLFDKVLRDDVSTQSWILLGAGLFTMLIPVYLGLIKIFKKCCSCKSNKVEQNYQMDYDSMRLKFPTEYERANPLTREAGQKEFKEFVQKATEGVDKESVANILLNLGLHTKQAANTKFNPNKKMAETGGLGGLLLGNFGALGKPEPKEEEQKPKEEEKDWDLDLNLDLDLDLAFDLNDSVSLDLSELDLSNLDDEELNLDELDLDDELDLQEDDEDDKSAASSQKLHNKKSLDSLEDA